MSPLLLEDEDEDEDEDTIPFEGSDDDTHPTSTKSIEDTILNSRIFQAKRRKISGQQTPNDLNAMNRVISCKDGKIFMRNAPRQVSEKEADEKIPLFWGRDTKSVQQENKVLLETISEMSEIHDEQQKRIFGGGPIEIDLDAQAQADKLLLRSPQIKNIYEEYSSMLSRRLKGQKTPWMCARATELQTKLYDFFKRYHMVDFEEAYGFEELHQSIFNKHESVSEKTPLAERIHTLQIFLERFE